MSYPSAINHTKLHWFEAEGLHMAVVASEGESSAELSHLTGAVLLADHEPILQCIDAWIGAELDWTPSDSDFSSQALCRHKDNPRLTVSLTSKEGVQRTIYLAIPFEQVVNLPEFEEPWLSLIDLKRHVSQFDVNLQNSQLSDEEADKLEPGSLILLKHSFVEHWPITFIPVVDEPHARACSERVGGVLNMQDNKVTLHNLSESQFSCTHSHTSNLSIRLNTPIVLNELYIGSAMDDGQSVSVALAEPLVNASVSVQHLQGRIVPVGHGLGVLLEQ